MPNEKISIILSSVPKPYILPDQYIKFLQRAGLQFGQWVGSDHVLLSECNEFIDLREDILDDEDLLLNFLFYGFNIKDCFFFLGQQGNVYAFFLLNGSSDPDVYFVNNADKPKCRKSTIKLTEFIIADYNNFVEAVQKYEET